MNFKVGFFLFLLSVTTSVVSFSTFSSFRRFARKTQPRILSSEDIDQHVRGCNLKIPIKFKYNDTGSNGNLPSSPGCPKAHLGMRWIYFEERPYCFLAGLKGPCGPGNVLTPIPGTFFGTCTCHCENKNQMRYSKDRYVPCGFEQQKLLKIYDKNSKTCYLNGTRGSPCGKYEVITGYTGTSILCKPECFYGDPMWKQALQNGKCVKAMGMTSGCGFAQTDNIGEADCPVGTEYSEKLQKCTKRVSLVPT